ncbi:uncharacterized protein BX663DRAFT_429776, partial [Cokeromyces recurvatus]|uniref:uncharacterized protein n=1 Tax=Cokeromyces recurvatus TaxID=90255 RepID=UPI00221EBD55
IASHLLTIYYERYLMFATTQYFKLNIEASAQSYNIDNCLFTVDTIKIVIRILPAKEAPRIDDLLQEMSHPI